MFSASVGLCDVQCIGGCVGNDRALVLVMAQPVSGGTWRYTVVSPAEVGFQVYRVVVWSGLWCWVVRLTVLGCQAYGVVVWSGLPYWVVRFMVLGLSWLGMI